MTFFNGHIFTRRTRPGRIPPALAWLTLLAMLLWAAPLRAALSGDDFLALCAESGPEAAQALRRAIAEGADVNYAGPEGLTPLMVFVGSHSDRDLEAASSLTALLAAGAEVNARSGDGATALSYALVHKAGPRLVSVLLRHGADPNLALEARGGLTPLMIAASVEPDPLVSALLLAAGARTDQSASRDGQSVGLAELAARNPNPQVSRFIEAAMARGGAGPEGLPLFVEAPRDESLRLRIKNLDQRIRSRAAPDDWLAWLDYIKWQTEVDAAVDLRRLAFGNSPAEAWLNEYVHYLEALEDKARRPALAAGSTAASEPRLAFQSGWEAPDAADFLAVAGREVIVIRRPRAGAVAGYERASGRELWVYAPSALSGLIPLTTPDGRPLLLLESHWGGGFGDAAVLEAESGRVLLNLPTLDQPRWVLSPDGAVLAVGTDYSLTLFDLRSLTSVGHSWFDLLEVNSWDEALAEARSRQRDLLAPLGLELDEQGFFKGGRRLFQGRPEAEGTMLAESRKALAAHNYNDLEVLALEAENGGGDLFVLGPACGRNCPAETTAQPLFLVSRRDNLIDGLTVDGRMLTVADLGWSGGPEGAGRPELVFSPGGKFLAFGAASGAVHFFAAAHGGKHLGSLAGETPVDQGRPLKDFRLAGLLDDDLGAGPLCALMSKTDSDGPPLVVAADFSAPGFGEIFRPAPGRQKKLAAFAAHGLSAWAAATAGGELWLIRPTFGTLEKLETPAGLHWTALAFSGDGRRLAAAESGGKLFFFEDGREIGRLPLKLKNIERLALDGPGTFAWLAGAEASEGRSGPALALADLSGRSAPLYRAAPGPVLELRFEPAANYAVAVAAVQPEADADGRPMQTNRWSQGRLDLIEVPFGQASRYSPGKNFVGLGPDLSEIFFQRLQPAQAFVNLGRETLNSRETSELESFSYQALIGPAAFDPSKRLALLPEIGRGGAAGGWPYQVGGAFYIYSLAGGREISAMTQRSLHPQGLAAAAFVGDGSLAVTAGWDGSLRLWDLSPVRPRNLLTWSLLEGDNWVVYDHDGRFDLAEPHSPAGLHWVASGRTLEPADFRALRQPRLPAYVLQNLALPPEAPATARSLFQPPVKIVNLAPVRGQSGLMNVGVEIGAVDDQGSPHPPGTVRLFLNGTLAGVEPGDGGPGLSSSGGLTRVNFENVPLPAGKTQAFFRAEAFNSDGLKSRSARASIKYQLKSGRTPRLFGLAAGLDSYSDPAWNPAPRGGPAPSESARTLAEAARSRFQGESLAAALTADLTKARLKESLEALRPAGPDDFILLSLALSGFTAGGQYYFLPADIGDRSGETPELLSRAVSSGELAGWLRELKAGGGLLLIEDLSPGPGAGNEAAPFEPGPCGDRNLPLLAEDHGLAFLCLAGGGKAEPALIGDLIAALGGPDFHRRLAEAWKEMSRGRPGSRFYDFSPAERRPGQ